MSTPAHLRIVGIDPGLRTTEAEYALDAIVFATGFEAMTGALKEIDVRTTDGRSLTADWERFFEWKRIEREDEPRDHASTALKRRRM